MLKFYRMWANAKTCIISLIIIVVLSIGCAHINKPNISAIYRVQALKNQLQPLDPKSTLQTHQELPLSVQYLLLQLYKIDPSLAIEVGRLPEFQAQVGDLQELSLSRFIEILTKASPEERANLRGFLEVGKPDFRRYCSPLQAIFWLLETNEYDTKETPLKYSLETLLFKSWKFSEKDRWKNYEVVTDRLNAPYLINYYELRQFLYFNRGGGTSENPDPYKLFYSNYGDCIDVTDFTVYCLRKGGYKAWATTVPSPTGRRHHYVTSFEMDNNLFIMDNGRPNQKGIVRFDHYK